MHTHPQQRKQKSPASTNQIGRGDPMEQPRFEVVRPPEVNNFVLEVFQSKSFKQKNAVKEITYKAKLKNPPEKAALNNLLHHLHSLFDTILNETRDEYGDNGVMRIYINHPKLEKAIIIPPTYLGYLDAEGILNYIDSVLYSAGEIPADDALEINAGVVHMIEGNGRKNMINVEVDIKNKRSFVRIVNTDNTCLPRAIVVGYAHLLHKEINDMISQKNYQRIRDPRLNAQKIEAEKLRTAVGIPIDRAGKIEDVPLYEDFLRVSIVVLSARIGNKRVYAGSERYDRRIFIYHYDTAEGGHFDTIVKVNSLMANSYYCTKCDKGFKNRTGHKCFNWCNICGREDCQLILPLKCPDCNRTCRSQTCFKAHKMEKKNGKGKNRNITLPSLCNQLWQCPDCGMTMKKENRNPAEHECGEVMCRVCQQFYLDHEIHLCYMRATSSEIQPDKFIFYDYECMQEDGKHIPNLVVAHSICSKCEKWPITNESKCNNCGSRCFMCDKYDKKEKEYERNPCEGCGFRQKIFCGEKTNETFCKWLVSEQHKNFTVIAHNARAYDAYFIYEYLMRNSIIPEPSIFCGSKIMYMQVDRGLNIRIIDSLNFLPMPLAKLPKSFGLTELKKGFFPHFFNTKEHQTVFMNHLPDMHYYDPDTMSKDRREEFLMWYEKNKYNTFDFQKEMTEYCISDVDILLKACWKFRELLKKETGEEGSIFNPDTMMEEIGLLGAVDPFSYLTIASVCMGVFRSKFLPESWSVLLKEEIVQNCIHDHECKCKWNDARKLKSSTFLEVLYQGEWIPEHLLEVEILKRKFLKSPIALIPSHGYSGRDNHSKECLEWLHILETEWKNSGKPIKIQHARSQEGEKIIHCRGKNRMIRYKADGYFQHNGKQYICEFYGCNFHGCPECYPRDREITMNDNKSIAQRYRETMLREKRLTEAGYIIISKWMCHFTRDKKASSGIRQQLDTLKIQDPINIRDCYFGGRTNALTLYKKFENGERGYYVDFTSLYPDILKYRRFPVGHPERITADYEPITIERCDGKCFYDPCVGSHWKLHYFGVMKATFLPPQNLLHPVLPLKCNGKLKFPLCYKCATEENDICNCSEGDRSFTHTYCTPEIEVAINMGYKLIHIHEVLHWKNTEMYNPEIKEGGLFTGYINTFLKLKQQASGYPEEVVTDLQKEKYIADYYRHEGIKLDKRKIEKNAGLRSLSKLALNSFYGKFGQRTNMKKTKFVTDIDVFYNMMTDPSRIVTDFHIMNENIIEVEYKCSEDFEPLSVNTNVTIASFCTSWARLKLWSIMNKLGKRVLYHDTDSIIFSVENEHDYIPPIGPYLGQLTSELTCKELSCNVKNCSGHYIEEFVSCGPKNYSYKVNTGQVICKVRGFSLNHKNSQVLNFQSMKEALFAWKSKKPLDIITIKTEIVRDKHEPKVINRSVSKHYGVVYDKRKILPDFTTLPFGFKN